MTAELAVPAAGQAASTAASAAVQLVKATLTEVPSAGLNTGSLTAEANAGPLVFDFNPSTVRISHTAPPQLKGGLPTGDLNAQLALLGDTLIDLDKLIFTGLTTKPTCERLLQWSFPATGVSANGDATATPIQLVFTWGASLSFPAVFVRQTTINYTRFVADGTPILAEVSLKLYIPNGGQGAPGPSQNPTSGGPAGRSTRVLDSSGCLASLAYATYDRPGAWRLVARANGIDDPLRVRPGTVLYLPQRAEPEPGTGARR
jgi:nucleoid-associated protein YgaU